MSEHVGSARCYKRGCRLPQCRRAHADRERIAKRERTRPDGKRRGNVRVKPDRARAHLLFLQSQGVGINQIEDRLDVARGTLWDIRAGRRKYILKSTEKRILGLGTHLFPRRDERAKVWLAKKLAEFA